MASRINDLHRARIQQIRGEAELLCTAAHLVAEKAAEVLDKGGQVTLAPQLQFMTGALMRLAKDIGTVEALQTSGAVQRRPMQVQGRFA